MCILHYRFDLDGRYKLVVQVAQKLELGRNAEDHRHKHALQASSRRLSNPTSTSLLIKHRAEFSFVFTPE